MNEHELEPLSSELDDLLQAERTRPSISEETRGRLYSRVAASVAVVGLVGAGAAAAHGSGATSTIGSFLARKVTIGIASFFLGGLAGAGVHAYATRAPDVKDAKDAKVVAVQGPSAPAVVTAVSPSVAPTTTTEITPVVSVPAVPSATAVAAVANSIGKPSTLKAEDDLLSVARTALKTGDAAGALVVVDDHAKRFPNGQLSQEREALAVQALAKSGRSDEARVRGDRFKKSFPGSLYLPVVEAALGSNK